jgi:hypothetical protein
MFWLFCECYSFRFAILGLIFMSESRWNKKGFICCASAASSLSKLRFPEETQSFSFGETLYTLKLQKSCRLMKKDRRTAVILDSTLFCSPCHGLQQQYSPSLLTLMFLSVSFSLHLMPTLLFWSLTANVASCQKEIPALSTRENLPTFPVISVTLSLVCRRSVGLFNSFEEKDNESIARKQQPRLEIALLDSHSLFILSRNGTERSLTRRETANNSKRILVASYQENRMITDLCRSQSRKRGYQCQNCWFGMTPLLVE